MPEQVTSYDAASGGDVVNQVQFEYNQVGSVLSEYQQHDGAVNISTSPKVQYAFDETAGGSGELTKGLRPVSVTYPNGRKLRYEYRSGHDDRLGRISYLADDAGGGIGTHLAEYMRLGLAQVVQVAENQPDLLFDLDHGAAGTYAGLDAFDRIVDLRWRKVTFPSTYHERVQLGHGYDRLGNRLWREDVRAADNGRDLDELYSYDVLERLYLLERGNVDTAVPSISSVNFAQAWTLDSFGNWYSFTQDDDGGGYDWGQVRTHNKANETTAIANAPTDWPDPIHDRAGNMTNFPRLGLSKIKNRYC